MGTDQPIGSEEHFVCVESLSALRTKEERERDMQGWRKALGGFLLDFPLKKVLFMKSN